MQHFHSVYRFEALFANVRAGWEKGSVENLVGYARRNYLVPLPEGASLAVINEELRKNCLADQQSNHGWAQRSHRRETGGRAKLLGPLPEHAPELALLAEVLVHSTGRVRFQTNDYSVPIRYAYQRLTLKADPFRVRVYAGADVVADHARSYEKHQVVEDWRHYVPLLLEKSFAVPWASALRHGDLPGSFEAARLDLVAQRDDGNREFVRLLELCLIHSVRSCRGSTPPGAKAGWLECGYGASSAQPCKAGHLSNSSAGSVQYPAYQAAPPLLRSFGLQSFAGGAIMTEDLRNKVVTTYLKQLRLSRMAHGL